MGREERLVSGDDMLAGLKRALHDPRRDAVLTSNELDDHIRIGLGESGSVAAPGELRHVGAADLVPVARGHGNDLEIAAGAFCKLRLPREQRLCNATANRSEAG
jgi:hypothetical protein